MRPGKRFANGLPLAFSSSMERLLYTLLLLVVLGFGATLAELPGLEARTDHATVVDAHQWYRTTRGWESSAAWQAQPVVAPCARVSPLVVGSLQLLISIGALLYCDPHLCGKKL